MEMVAKMGLFKEVRKKVLGEDLCATRNSCQLWRLKLPLCHRTHIYLSIYQSTDGLWDEVGSRKRCLLIKVWHPIPLPGGCSMEPDTFYKWVHLTHLSCSPLSYLGTFTLSSYIVPAFLASSSFLMSFTEFFRKRFCYCTVTEWNTERQLCQDILTITCFHAKKKKSCCVLSSKVVLCRCSLALQVHDGRYAALYCLKRKTNLEINYRTKEKDQADQDCADPDSNHHSAMNFTGEPWVFHSQSNLSHRVVGREWKVGWQKGTLQKCKIQH